MKRMTRILVTVTLLLSSMMTAAGQDNPLPNTLSEQERQDGWMLLFDGSTTDGWTGTRTQGFPQMGWVVENGELVVLPAPGDANHSGGDIITTREFKSFELSLEFKLAEGANSGIKYFMDPNLLKEKGSALGLEYSILDDAAHPDAKMGVAGNRTQGSLYDLIPAGIMLEPEKKEKMNKAIGEWNQLRIVVKGKNVQHWLNGINVLEFKRATPMFRALVANSKYAGKENFGEWKSTPILLQDHGDRVAFRSIKIRELQRKKK
jgi:hypothetical protein